jgi:hypothetical protein
VTSVPDLPVAPGAFGPASSLASHRTLVADPPGPPRDRGAQEIPKRERPPETIRVSVIPLSGGYADLRVYRGGPPTRQGLAIHRDLLPAVLDGLRAVIANL